MSSEIRETKRSFLFLNRTKTEGEDLGGAVGIY